VTAEEVPGVIRRMQERLSREGDRARDPKPWAATYILMGLRYEQAFTVRLFEEVGTMEESVTYQAIIAKGAKNEARKILLTQGEERFGTAAPAEVRAALEAIEDLARLEELARRVVTAPNWEELLGTSTPPRQGRRRTKKS
jgi:hypothetical protein